VRHTHPDSDRLRGKSEIFWFFLPGEMLLTDV